MLDASAGAMLLRLLVLACLLYPLDADAWRRREHRAIGAESYVAACTRLEAKTTGDPQIAARYEIACGNLKVQSFLYGQGTAVGGDFLDDPDEFMTSLGAQLVTRRSNFYRLALQNSTHFQPLATREWRRMHTQATTSALIAARKQGAAQLDAFDQAFYDSAFGDHFLHDSFAAGHMGFNRPASSAAASKVFHDHWNREGRMVSNRRGAVWRTYGDGRLDRPESREARKHVVAAATESVYGVLATFVLGTYDPEPDFAVWNECIFTIEDPEILPNLETLFAGSEELGRPEFLPTLSVKRPAVKDGALGVWSAYVFPFDDMGDPTGTVVFGGDLRIPYVGVDMEVGVGAALNEMSDMRFAVDAAFVKPLALTFDGLLSHEVGLGSLFLISNELDTIPHASIRTNLEGGDLLLGLNLGLSYSLDDEQWGLYGSLGLRRVLDAAGGGGFF
jgi:hypothetical protein